MSAAKATGEACLAPTTDINTTTIGQAWEPAPTTDSGAPNAHTRDLATLHWMGYDTWLMGH